MIVDQTTFRAALLDPEAERPEGLLDGAGAPAGRRFDVYRNNVAVSLTEALETAFPVIQKLLGEANFKIVAGAFLRAHPPSSPVMMFYGAEMPDFLAAFPPTAKMGYLGDVARLELALRHSYHAGDAPAIDPTELQALAPDELVAARFTLAPSLRLIRSDWPVFSIWTYNMEDGAPKPQAGAQDTLVVRPEFDPMPLLLPQGGGGFVAALLEGQSLSDALEFAGEGFDLSTVLSQLISANAIVNIHGDTTC